MIRVLHPSRCIIMYYYYIWLRLFSKWSFAVESSLQGNWITEISHLKWYTSILNSSIEKHFWSVGLGSFCCCSRRKVAAITNWKWQRNHTGSKCEDSCCYWLAGQSHVFHRFFFASVRSFKLLLCLSKNTSDRSTWNVMDRRFVKEGFPWGVYWWIHVMWYVGLLIIWLDKIQQNKKCKFDENNTLTPTKHKSTGIFYIYAHHNMLSKDFSNHI